ncbi:hypothetical protein E4U40_006108 [Claviceps sp. LM458 group G5]|nr:hypothetical protein E4U40_006108 [Claviceps sp. LM458 group G5]
MDYFFKKAVESVKKRRRSRDEVATDAMIEGNLHLAARNCILNVAPTHTWSVTSKELADFHASSEYVDNWTANLLVPLFLLSFTTKEMTLKYT